MNKLKLIVISVLLMGGMLNVLSAQTYEFNLKGENSKAPNDRIGFKILGITSQDHANLIETKISQIDGIANVEISYLYKCRLVVDGKVNVEAVRQVLIDNATDFFFPSLNVSDESLYNNLDEFRDVMIPDDFPNASERSDLEAAKAFDQEVYEWGRRNPERYAILVELGYVVE